MAKVLVVGGGGREHALAWKLASSLQVEKVFVAPGNAGTAAEAGVENLALPASDIEKLADFAAEQRLALTVVGPEVPLTEGIADVFAARGLPCFGPAQKAAQLEGSKSFSKDFLARHAIPTAGYQAFTEEDAALAFLQEQPVPVVIKADGLAAGKGVTVAFQREDAEAAVRHMLSGDAFGAAGRKVVIEEFLQGEEVSFIAMLSGGEMLPLASSQDHKARDDGDKGPNTGGMGAYSPAPAVDSEMHEKIMAEIMQPVAAGLAEENIPYTGFLYAGLMIGEDGCPRVLEFNCRLGDPEAQPLLMRLRSDLYTLCQEALAGGLGGCRAEWDSRAALGVVLAAQGYPGPCRKGDPITLPVALGAGAKIFHAGTRLEGEQVLTAGGRVLCVTALGDTVGAARDAAYRWCGQIHWQGMFCRQDIAHRAIARERDQ